MASTIRSEKRRARAFYFTSLLILVLACIVGAAFVPSAAEWLTHIAWALAGLMVVAMRWAFDDDKHGRKRRRPGA
jgi:hypothetical protein